MQSLGLPKLFLFSRKFAINVDSVNIDLILGDVPGAVDVNSQAVFTPESGQWTRTLLPLAAFEPSFRGRGVQGAPPLQSEMVRQVGLMISDSRAGEFRLMVKTIEAVPTLTFASQPMHWL